MVSLIKSYEKVLKEAEMEVIIQDCAGNIYERFSSVPQKSHRKNGGLHYQLFLSAVRQSL
jgi:hypothetical protein